MPRKTENEQPQALSEHEARAIMSGGLGRAELKFVASLTAPLFWVIKQPSGELKVRNGTAFFLDAGEGPFGVTAAHVIDGYECDRAASHVVAVQLGDLQIDLIDSLIDSDLYIDIATFRVTPEQIKMLGKTALRGHQREWPPAPPLEGRGINFAGYPGTETLFATPREFNFGIAAGGGVASSVSEVDVSAQIEREHLIPLLGAGVPPENYDFGGISGGPMLAMVEVGGLRIWSLAGVVYQGPNTSDDEAEAIAGLEVIRARRAKFILPNGLLNRHAWENIT